MNHVITGGLYRSGTNYCRDMIRANFAGHIAPAKNNPFTGRHPYKHSWNAEELRAGFHPDTKAFMVFKEPAKWVDSICRQSWDLVDFWDLELRPGETPIWIKYDDEHNHMIDDCRIRVSLERLVDLFNRWARAWRDHPPCDALIIKHSSLVFDLSYNVERIAKFLGAPMPSEITSPGLVPMSRQFTGVIRDQYNNPDYFEFLDDSTAQKARSLVDPGVTAWLSFTQ